MTSPEHEVQIRTAIDELNRERIRLGEPPKTVVELFRELRASTADQRHALSTCGEVVQPVTC